MKENLKKLFAVVLAVAMLAAQVVVPTNAATGYYCSKCEDAAELTAGATALRKIEPTCGKDGYLIYACENTECEDGTITVVVPATGKHEAAGALTQEVPATCTAEGTLAYTTCTGCGKYLDANNNVLDSLVIAKKAHDYKATVKDPDCTNGGYTTYKCKNCPDTYVDDKKPCLNHDFSVDVPKKDATCKEEGYKAYVKCSRCDATKEPIEVIPVQDHNLHIDEVRSLKPDCINPGYNRFVCDNQTCPYYKEAVPGTNITGEGVLEHLDALDHELTSTAANAATCTAAGNHAYWTCSVCNGIYKTADAEENAKFANLDKTVIPATGHTEIAIAYKEATCNEKGARDGIMCVVCKEILHASVEVAPKGHTLTTVNANASTCDTQGNIEHKQCSVCQKLFAKTTSNDKTVNYNATPLSAEDVKLPLRAHVKVDRVAQDATCTEPGVKVTTCTYKDCNFVVSDIIPAKGHTFKAHAAKAAKCTEAGNYAYNECTVCNKFFADDADPKDVTIVGAADATGFAIAQLGHKYIETQFVAPTYNAAGTTKGEKCERCNIPNPQNPATVLPELDEAIKFTYEVTGVKDTTDIAVNSGKVYLKIYFEVLADDDDEYVSDVLANIFGIDFTVDYDAAFKLVSVDDVNVPFKGNFNATPVNTANTNSLVKISQNAATAAGVAFKKADGKVLLTTLEFDVKDDAAAADYDFDFSWDIIHPEFETVDTAASRNEVTVTVKTLGDANLSGLNGGVTFTQADVLLIMQYIEEAAASETPVDYVAEYDMNKDGYIDGVDLSLLRRAIVGDNAYLN